MVYFDSDFFFFRNPMECVAMCPADSMLCGSKDSDWMQSKTRYKYVNAGFLIIKPNRRDADYLVGNYKKASVISSWHRG